MTDSVSSNLHKQYFENRDKNFNISKITTFNQLRQFWNFPNRSVLQLRRGLRINMCQVSKPRLAEITYVIKYFLVR